MKAVDSWEGHTDTEVRIRDEMKSWHLLKMYLDRNDFIESLTVKWHQVIIQEETVNDL